MKPSTILAAIALGVSLALLSSCAKVTLSTQCPAGTTGVGFALSGSTVGNTLLSMLGTAVAGAKIAGPIRDTAAPTTATMSYEYIPIFGSDSGSLTCTSPAAAPGVLVPGPPPQILH